MGVYGSVTCMYVCLHVHVYTNRGGAEFRVVSPWCGAETDCGTVGTRSRVMMSVVGAGSRVMTGVVGVAGTVGLQGTSSQPHLGSWGGENLE